MEPQTTPPPKPQPSQTAALDPDTAWRLWLLADEISTELWYAFDPEFSDRVLREMEQEERSRAGPPREQAD